MIASYESMEQGPRTLWYFFRFGSIFNEEDVRVVIQAKKHTWIVKQEKSSWVRSIKSEGARSEH